MNKKSPSPQRFACHTPLAIDDRVIPSRPFTSQPHCGNRLGLTLALALLGFPAGLLHAQISIGGDVSPSWDGSIPWNVGGALFIGSSSNSGMLTIIDGGAVSNTSGYIGYTFGTGTVNVSGGTWTNSGNLSLGDFDSTGTLNISGTGAVSNTNGFIGDGGTGTTNVSGGTWTNFGALLLGTLGGTGTLEISGTGAVSSTNGFIGSDNGTGTATVSGGTWTNSVALYVGNLDGTGTLNISGTGAVSNPTAFIGGNDGTGTVNVSGGTWTNSGDLYVGYFDGTGTLNISGTGAVSSSSVFLTSNSSSQGTLNLNGGTLSTGQVSKNSGTGTVNFDGGTLRLTGNQAALFSGFGSGDITLNAGGGTIDTQSFSVATSQVLQGVGGLTKTGSGTLTLTGANTYTGGTTISAGTLQIGNGGTTGSIAGNIVNNGNLIFNRSADYWYNGVVSGSGNFTLNPGSTLIHPSTYSILRLSSAQTYTGTTTIGAGTYLVLPTTLNQGLASATHVEVEAGGFLDISNRLLTISGLTGSGIVYSFGGSTGNLTLDIVGSSTFAGILGGGTGGNAPNFGVTKAGTGTQIFTGANTYTGATTINEGTLVYQNTNASESHSIASGAVLELYVDAGRRDSAVDTVFSGNGTLRKTGAGEITWGATSATFNLGAAGLIDVQEGTFIGGSSANEDWTNNQASLNVAAGAFFNGVEANVRVGALTGAGTIRSGYVGAGYSNFTFGVGNASGTFSGILSNQDGFLGNYTKVGSGTQILTGASTYTGTTSINAGTLLVNGSLGNTTVAVNNGGTLGGSGTIGGVVTVNSGGVLTPGNSPGTLSVAGLTLASGSSTIFELGAPAGTPGVDSDLINVSGLLTLGGGGIQIVNYGGMNTGTYTLFNYGTRDGSALPIQSAPGGFNFDLSFESSQVLLDVNYNGLQFWDGSNTAAPSTPGGQGGNGSWTTAGTNWTNGNGNVNSAWSDLTAVFGGSAGTVTLGNDVNVSGLHFITNGYEIAGAGHTISGTAPFNILVDAGLTATISATLAGTEAMTKVNDGTLILTGANNFTGGITISGGTLQFGTGGNPSGPVVGNITNNSELIFNYHNDWFWYNGVVSGTGNLTQNRHILRLSQAQTYTGTTTIKSGAVLVLPTGTNQGLSSATRVELEEGGFFDLSSTAITIAGLTGMGTVYSWGTSDGHLTLDIATDSSYTFGGVMGITSGGGAPAFSITKAGEGTQILTGANNYTGTTTISGGTLQLGNGGTTGSILGNVTNNANLTFNRSNAYTFSGMISGSGSVTQDGTGVLTLTGANTYSGVTSVNSGTLMVNNSSGSATGSGAVVVNNGGVLGGSGIIGGNLTIESGGILAPGNSTGILTLGGNLNLNSGAITQMEINGTTPGTGHDQIVVGGTATLGGTLELFFGGGMTNGDTFTLIETTNPILGNFDSVVNVLGNALTFSSTITDDYLVTITAVQTDYEPFALTRNQRAVATTIDDQALTGDLNDLINFLNTLPGTSLPAAFDVIAPTQFAFLPDVVFGKTRFRQRGLSGQMRERRGGASGMSTSRLQVSSASGSIDWINSALMAPSHDRHFVSATGATGTTAAPMLPSADNRWGFFASGTFEHIDDDRNGPGNKSNGGGLTLGADYQVNDSIIVGFFAGYEHSELDFGSNGGDVGGSAATYGLYGTWHDSIGNWLEGSLGGGYHRFNTTRNVFGAEADGKTNANEFWANITYGHDIELGSRAEWTLTPSAGISYNALHTDGFTETGSLAPLTLQGQTAESLRSEIGLRLDYRREWSGVTWLPYVHCGWQHELLDTSQSVNARFATGGGIFTVNGPGSSRNTAVFGTGLNAMFSDTLSAGVGYNGEANNNFQIHQVFASLRMRF